MGVPLGFSGDWLLIVLVSSSIWIADELFKLMGVYRMAEKKGQYIESGDRQELKC
jgi:hypothetical protein